MLRLNFHATLFETNAGQTFFSPACGPRIEESCFRSTVLHVISFPNTVFEFGDILNGNKYNILDLLGSYMLIVAYKGNAGYLNQDYPYKTGVFLYQKYWCIWCPVCTNYLMKNCELG